MSFFTSINILLLVIISEHRVVDSVSHKTNLIWSQQKNNLEVSKIFGIEGDPKLWVGSSKNLIMKRISAPNTHWHFKDLTFHYHKQMLIWSEAGNKRIQGLYLNGSKATLNFVTGTSSEVDGLAMDWLSGNLYWSDAVYNWIKMVPLSSTSKVDRIVIDDGLDKPMGVVVHPERGYLFWNDWGVQPSIGRSDLLGNNRQTLINDRLIHPRGMAIDFSENRLYWVDSGYDWISSVGFTGLNRKTVIRQPYTTFYGIAVYDDYIFVTERRNRHLQIYSKTSRVNYRNYKLLSEPYGIIMYKDTLQPGSDKECIEKKCDQICIKQITGPKCYCGDGFNLDVDERSCVENRSKFIEYTHIFTIKTAVCFYQPNIADMQFKNMSLSKQCFIKDGKVYNALAYDAWKETLFYSVEGNGTSSIASYRLVRNGNKETIVKGAGSIQGIAVDYMTSNIYWTDKLLKQIAVATYDGSYPYILFNTSLVNPTGIALDPYTRKLYWTDPGLHRIEESYLDGSDRKILFKGGSRNFPNHLFLDIPNKKLYWTDSGRETIQMMDLKSGNQRTIYYQVNSQMYGISVFKDYVIWTDSNDKNGLHIALTKTGKKVRGIVHPKIGEALDVVTYTRSNQPTLSKFGPCLNDSSSCNPCFVNNGGCDHLCLANNSSSPTCICGVGFIKTSNNSCVSHEQLDNFILVADNRKKQIFQISLVNLRINTVKVESHGNPVALDYDPVMGEVYWSDISKHVIKRVRLDGSQPRVIHSTPKYSTWDGIAVDYIHRLLYYSDTSKVSIGVISMNEPFWSKRLISNDLDKPRDIAVHPLIGYMFWTDWGITPKIVKSTMDGKSSVTIFSYQHSSWPNGITIDYREQRIYWCDAKRETISSSDFNGKNSEILFREKDAHYFGITLTGNNLYLTDWKRRTIRVVNKNKPKMLRPFGPAVFGNLNGIQAYNSSEVLTSQNHCVTKNCSQLCLPNPQQVTCACVDGYQLDHDLISCVYSSQGLFTSTVRRPTASDHTNKISHSRKAVTVTFVPAKTETSSTSLDSTSGSSSRTSDSTEATLPSSESDLSVAGLVGLVLVLISCLCFATILGICFYKRWHRGGRSRLKDERGVGTFERVTFSKSPSVSSDTMSDSGIENPLYGWTVNKDSTADMMSSPDYKY